MSHVYTVIIAPEAVIEVSEIAIWWNENRRPRLFQTEPQRGADSLGLSLSVSEERPDLVTALELCP